EDLVTSITATNVGDETIRWSARPVQARHMRFTDSYTTFDAWVHPRGYMLRLEQGSSGLKGEREPSPAVKRKAEPTPHCPRRERRCSLESSRNPAWSRRRNPCPQKPFPPATSRLPTAPAASNGRSPGSRRRRSTSAATSSPCSASPRPGT